MASDEYEIVPKNELQALREEVAQLKREPLSGYESSVNLLEAMDRLAGQMAHLIRIFEQANKEIYEEYSAGHHDQSQKLDRMIAQNEKIARGVLAVADSIHKERSPSLSTPPAVPPKQAPPEQKPPEKNPPAKTEGTYPLHAHETSPEHARKRMVSEFR